MTRLSDFEPGETITVTPVRTFPIVRDLVTDVSYNYEKASELPAFAPPPRDDDGKRRMAQVDVERGQEFRKCIECFLCQNVCHVIRDHEDNKPAFAGPRFFLRYAELDMHPLDTHDRRELAQAAAGIGMCNITKCCTEVCPEGIKITDNAIIPMKERVADKKYDPLVWLGETIGVRNRDNVDRRRVGEHQEVRGLKRPEDVAAEVEPAARVEARPVRPGSGPRGAGARHPVCHHPERAVRRLAVFLGRSAQRRVVRLAGQSLVSRRARTGILLGGIGTVLSLLALAVVVIVYVARVLADERLVAGEGPGERAGAVGGRAQVDRRSGPARWPARGHAPRRVPSAVSWPSTRPRRAARSLITVPTRSSGTRDLHLVVRLEDAPRRPPRPPRAAPARRRSGRPCRRSRRCAPCRRSSVTRTSTIGWPAQPRSIWARTPFSTDGMNCRGTDAADDPLGELEPGPAGERLDLDLADGVLPVAAGLLHVPAQPGAGLGRASRAAPPRTSTWPTETPNRSREPLQRGVGVRLAHRPQHRAARCPAIVDAQRRVLGGQPVERGRELVLVGLGGRLDRRPAAAASAATTAAAPAGPRPRRACRRSRPGSAGRRWRCRRTPPAWPAAAAGRTGRTARRPARRRRGRRGRTRRRRTR